MPGPSAASEPMASATGPLHRPVGSFPASAAMARSSNLPNRGAVPSQWTTEERARRMRTTSTTTTTTSTRREGRQGGRGERVRETLRYLSVRAQAPANPGTRPPWMGGWHGMGWLGIGHHGWFALAAATVEAAGRPQGRQTTGRRSPLPVSTARLPSPPNNYVLRTDYCYR